MEDLAKTATNQQKAEAFEWLRQISLSDSPDAEHAAVLAYEITRLQSALHRAVAGSHD